MTKVWTLNESERKPKWVLKIQIPCESDTEALRKSIEITREHGGTAEIVDVNAPPVATY